MSEVVESELVPAIQMGGAQISRLMEPEVLKEVGILLRGWCANRSKDTIRARFGDLRLFASFVHGGDDALEGSRDVPVRAATAVLGVLRQGESQAEAVVAVYIDWMEEQHYAPTTKARRIASLRSWAKHLRKKGVAPCDLHGVPIPRFDAYNNAKGPPISVVLAAVKQLEEEADSGESRDGRFLALRDKTIVVLLMLSFVRRAELLRLNWGDIDSSDERARFRVRAKGGSLVWKDVGRLGTAALQTWHRAYQERFGTPHRSAPLVVGVSGKRLSESRLYGILKAMLGCGPHGIRHTGATALAHDLASAHRKLGHKSLDTTKVYLDSLDDSAEKGTDAIADLLRGDR